jgi:hypothetical protein
LKKTVASWPYKGDLKAKSTLKLSQQLVGVGPGANSHLHAIMPLMQLAASYCTERTLSVTSRLCSHQMASMLHKSVPVV